MRTVVACTGLLFLAACAHYVPPGPAAPREGLTVAASFGRTWDAVIDEFAAKNIPIRTLERASGFIATDRLGVEPEIVGVGRELRDPRADCGYNSDHVPAVIAPNQATYNIVVRGDSARSFVRVTVKWVHDGGLNGATYQCETTAQWESALEEYIRRRAEGPRAEPRAAPGEVPAPRQAPSPTQMPAVTSARPLNVTIRTRFVDPDSTVTPIPDFDVRLIGQGNDTTAVRTNALGIATAQLPPGRYRAVPSKVAEFEGRGYSWDVAFTVRMGMGPVDLTQRNAKIAPPRR
jgi:hypothetical protein